MLTYPLSRPQYLLGKVLFNVGVAAAQAAVTVALSTVLFGVDVRAARVPLLLLATIVATAGWFFFYAIFALRIRRNDVFNTVTSAFYFFFLFASSMFYPIDPLPRVVQVIALANPITWHVDVLRYLTIGLGSPATIALEAAAFTVFTFVSFGGALRSLEKEG